MGFLSDSSIALFIDQKNHMLLMKTESETCRTRRPTENEEVKDNTGDGLQKQAGKNVFSLPMEVLELIVEQLAANPKTTVVDYYNWLKAIGNTNTKMSALLKSKVAVCDMTQGKSEFTEILGSDENIVRARKGTIPSNATHFVLEIDSGSFNGKETNVPAPYGNIQLTVVYHCDQQPSLKKLHADICDRFSLKGVRHLVLITDKQLPLEFTSADGNLLDSTFYDYDAPLFPEITYLTAKQLRIGQNSLSECLSNMTEAKSDHYYESRSPSGLAPFFRTAVSFPALESIKFFSGSEDDDCLNKINLWAIASKFETCSKPTLREIFLFYSLRYWHLPTITEFTGHHLQLESNSSNLYERESSTKGTIEFIRKRAQSESPDGLLHINTQLIPDGVKHTCLSNWISMDTKFDREIVKNRSPLICFRHSTLESLKLGLVTKPEGSMVIEGLYLPNLKKLHVYASSDFATRVRFPFYHLNFSDWNDLSECRTLTVGEKSFGGRTVVSSPNLKNVLSKLDREALAKKQNEETTFYTL